MTTRLLRYLMLNANRVVSKSQILSRVWSQDFTGDASIVESYISQLRHKVDAAEPPLIHTKRGIGYVLRLPPGHPIAASDPGNRQREAATG